MSGLQGKTTNGADDIAGSRAVEERQSQWGEIPGEIISFDAEKQTASIRPLYKPTFNGVQIQMPDLLEVPVRFQRSAGGAITYPIAPGDKVSLRPQMRSSENYHTGTGETSSDARSFALSDMEAFLDGGNSLEDPIKNFDPSNMHIRADDEGKFGIKMSAEGKINIAGSEGNIYDLLVEVINLLGKETTTVSSGSSAGEWPLTNQAKFAEIAEKLKSMSL